MAKTVQDVMTANPITLPRTASAVDAARVMRDSDIGPVIVTDGDRICGIVTDRDITVRAVAEGRNPSDVQLGDICTPDPTTVAPSEPVKEALERMRQQAIRRLIVADEGKPLGIVSLGDLSDHGEADDTLRDISEAPANS